MDTSLHLLALLLASLFTGACVYIVVVEQPARTRMPSRAALTEFRNSLPRAERMQPPLLIASLMMVIAAYLVSPNRWLVAGGAILFTILPLSFGLLVPINRTLCGGTLEDVTANGMRLLRRWGALHAVRTAIALTGTVTIAVAAANP